MIDAHHFYQPCVDEFLDEAHYQWGTIEGIADPTFAQRIAHRFEIEPAREGAWTDAFNAGVEAYNAGNMEEATTAWERANAIYTRDPLQRYLRDLQAIGQHFSFNFDIAGSAYGTVALGGPPQGRPGRDRQAHPRGAAGQAAGASCGSGRAALLADHRTGDVLDDIERPLEVDVDPVTSTR